MRVLSEIDLDQLHGLEARHESLWLDLRDPGGNDVAAVGEVLGLHPLAVEDSLEFGQRPKLNRYDARLLLVFFGLHIQDEAHRARSRSTSMGAARATRAGP